MKALGLLLEDGKRDECQGYVGGSEEVSRVSRVGRLCHLGRSLTLQTADQVIALGLLTDAAVYARSPWLI
jgi:hypothetical protein